MQILKEERCIPLRLWVHHEMRRRGWQEFAGGVLMDIAYNASPEGCPIEILDSLLFFYPLHESIAHFRDILNTEVETLEFEKEEYSRKQAILGLNEEWIIPEEEGQAEKAYGFGENLIVAWDGKRFPFFYLRFDNLSETEKGKIIDKVINGKNHLKRGIAI